MLTISVFCRDGTARRIALSGRPIRIGRDDANDLVLADPGMRVALRHAEVRREGIDDILVDLGGEDGTWVDGQRVARAILRPDMTIRIGNCELAVREQENTGESGSVPADDVTLSSDGSGTLSSALPDSETLFGVQETGHRTSGLVGINQGRQRPTGRGRSPTREGLVRRVLALPRGVVIVGLAVGLVAVLFIGLLSSGVSRSTRPVAAAGSPAGSARDREETNEEIVQRLLAGGRAAMARGEYDAAINRYFDQILLIDPERAEALELRVRAQDLMRSSGPAGSPAGVVAHQPVTAAAESQGARNGRASRPAIVVADSSPCRASVVAGQDSPTVREHVAAVQARFDEGRLSLGNGRFAMALSAFQALQQESITCRGLENVIEQAKAGLRMEAEKMSKAGAAAEQRGDLIAALKSYTLARDAENHAANVDDAIIRVRDRMRADGEEALRRARQYDSLGRFPEAMALYARAVECLPERHPDRQVARDRLAALRGGIR
ncbi:MAG: FHA domain-containing protein [Acidobacteria bacterium]|nr:FHA domain-containing protein [Acidobacteriota bacterium]